MKDKLILKCKRCGHEWVSRIPNPKSCPRCKQYKWNIPLIPIDDCANCDIDEPTKATCKSCHSEAVKEGMV